MADISHPKHYTFGSIEVIDVLEDWKLGFRLANAVKYIARCDHKGNAIQDLRKAAWYLCRDIDKRLEAEGIEPDQTGLQAESVLRTRTQAVNSQRRVVADAYGAAERSEGIPSHVRESADVIGIELPDGRILIDKNKYADSGDVMSYSEWCDRYSESSRVAVLIPLDGDPNKRRKGRRRHADPRSALLAHRVVRFLHERVPDKFHVSELMKELGLKQAEHKKLCHYLSRLNRQGMIHRVSRGIYGASK